MPTPSMPTIMTHKYTILKDEESSNHIDCTDMDNVEEVNNIPQQTSSNRYIHYTVLTLAILSWAASLLVFLVLDNIHLRNQHWHCQEESVRLYSFTLALKQTWLLKGITTLVSQFVLLVILRRPFSIPNHWALLWHSVQIWVGAGVGGQILASFREFCYR